MTKFDRRDFLKTTTAVAASSLLPRSSFGAEVSPSQPNIVLLLIDDLGLGDIGCFGNRRIPTPHMDSLASNGAKCTMAYVTNPPCSPSRSSVMTGMYAQRFGKSGMARGVAIPEDHPTLAELLRNAGYVTGMIGKWDIGNRRQGPHRRGFTHVARRAPGKFYECKRRDGSWVYRTDFDAECMVEFVNMNADQPFFLYFSPFAVHLPHNTTPKKYSQRISAPNPSQYEGAVVAVDDAVGQLLKALKEHGLDQDTLIMLASDNGPNREAGGRSTPYRGGKGAGHTKYEGWVHVPTLVSWPRKIPAGVIFPGLTATFDFYSTAAAAAGVSAPEKCDGKDLLPFLQSEESQDVHRELYWHNADPTDYPHRNISAVRWEQWRLVRYPSGWRLFDLQEDPQETEDLASAHPEIVADLSQRHALWVESHPPPIESGGGGRAFDPPKGWGWIVS